MSTSASVSILDRIRVWNNTARDYPPYSLIDELFEEVSSIRYGQSDLVRHRFAESGVGGRRELDQARRTSEGLGLFLWSLIGLDRQAATEAFDEFLVDRNLAANQTDLIELMIDHLTENGVMEPSRLYESPFTDIAPLGPDGIFRSRRRGPVDRHPRLGPVHRPTRRADGLTRNSTRGRATRVSA